MRMNRTARRYWLIAILCVGLAAVYALWPKKWQAWGQRAPGSGESFTLDQLCQEQFKAGWKVKHPPDLPGPYRQRLPGMLYDDAGGAGSIVRHRDRSGAILWEEKTRPGVEFYTLELVTTDGRQTQGLLVRGE